jgi:hypothetical protein
MQDVETNEFAQQIVLFHARDRPINVIHSQ